MREKLKKLDVKERFLFEGEFVRSGFKSYKNHFSPTFLIKNLKLVKENDKKEFLSDHLWLNYGKNFLKLGKLKNGDIIRFNARVSDYYKGYFKEEKDFKLSFPTNVKLINKTDEEKELVPLDNNNALIGMILLDNKNFYKETNRQTLDDSFYIESFHKWKNKQNKIKKENKKEK